MAQMTEVLLPDIGDFADVEVIELLVSPGDRIAREDSILTLESDKATMEIPSPHDGVVSEVRVAIGDRIKQGSLLLLMQVGEDAAQPAAEEVEDADEVESTPVPVAAAPVAAEPAAVESKSMEIPLPDIGDFKDVEVIEILVAVGDQVEVEDSIITLESDKATMEIPSPAAGRVQAVTVAAGDKINQGDLLIVLDTVAAQTVADATQAAAEPAAVAEPARAPERAIGEKEAKRRPVIAKPSDAPRGKAHASPAVRRFARELGVDLYQVPGSGHKGRITKEDVQNYVKGALAEGSAAATAAPGSAGPLALPTAPEIDFSRFGEIEEKALGRIKKISGAHLHRSWLGVPHVSQFDEADISELEAFRKSQKDSAAKQDVRLTFMPFLMKALAAVMREYPQFNASLSADGERLIYKKYLHIGVAVDTPNGLMVPVVRDVDKKGVFELARDLMEMSGKARDGKLAPGDMQGGCISISSLGGIGGTQFTPIVNAPEVAILGISRAEMKPKWNGSDFEPRLMMPFSLSYDHRVIDGAEGVRFTTRLAGLLADIRTLLL